MRHVLTKLLAASGTDSPTHSDSPAQAAPCSLSPDLTRATAAEDEETAAFGSPGSKQPRGDQGEVEGRRGARGGVAVRAPSPEEMEEEAVASVPGEETEDMDFLSGLELADLLDPRQPDWHLEPGLSSPGPLSSSGGGSDSGGLWRGDDDDESAAAEMQRFSDLLQRLLNGIGGCSSGSDSGSGEKRRRKSPGGGGGGGGSGNDNTQAATKSPRKAAAAAARLNRLKKKEYVMGLESRVRALAAENQELRAENRELGKRVQALQEESRYLRAVLANETGLARLLSRLSGVGLRLTTSLFRDSPAGDHDYALPVGKQQQDLLEEDDSAGGVCLHVDKDKVSVEFCSACARKASSSLKIFFFR
ncbi:CREB/ATF bZIP transcription factor isoform X1 [Sturnira hondurensis]|uniref:CREB/ATF bZIP transcription factor isoform X1 n=1 Tax=Sturnira hondurensis TaxID=192404 RepID=UPI001879CFC8|nr:CREB/ATF bZIP transcription factor isoform X1 [Sturnira hondurensis]XP_036898758.1 CREB/ATF bZIP transcription factor isoform X1 [Sturnira hondurensis]XP_036898759.1 CREB/ATF bZIP transcription factor isoform X1 [Sturnira hondurensis]XP_036898760.1 CREB/ATF bZIP transcription factor isoform X1 [Sturnira hondurensis]XP_036898761.1 CREB/ATF bZIP transcription factor isoform X1 [Sturnira hondurensis]XP_036898762.1 CREB/ATF bZIP transcription factor isoform X1 [Sturnira hondurensis]